MEENNDIKPEFRKLIASLKSLDKPFLFAPTKELIKNKILAQTTPKVKRSLIRAIYFLARDVYLDANRKFLLKERIFSGIALKNQRNFSWSRFFVFNRKMGSFAMLFVFVFSFFAFVNVDTRVVRAESFTRMDSYTGDVSIERSGELVEVYQGMEIIEKDRIVTGDGSVAVIEYLDDSVTRLAENTVIVVNRLEGDEDNVVSTYVEVAVVEGNLWSKVVNLVHKESSFVVVAEHIYTETQKAAFNVEVDDNDVEVEVFTNFVEVSSPVDTEPNKVTHGNKVKSLAGVNNISVQKIVAVEEDENWVRANLEKDKDYVGERLIAKKGESLGLDISDDVSAGLTLREKTLLLFTFDDVEKQKLELDIAEKNFVAAELKLHDEDLTKDEREEVEGILKSYSQEVEEFNQMVADLEDVDGDFADELRGYVKEKVELQKKDVAAILPDSPAYEAKQILGELEILVVEDEEELMEVKRDQALDKLQDVELIVEEDQDLALTLAGEYQEEIDEIIEIIEDMDSLVAKEEVIEEMEEGLDVLVEIEVVDDDVLEELVQDLEEVKDDIEIEIEMNSIEIIPVEIVAPDTGSNQVSLPVIGGDIVPIVDVIITNDLFEIGEVKSLGVDDFVVEVTLESEDLLEDVDES